jgi:regulator of protease activity HflC (stomatin/prohibitin superfamily)
MLFTIAFIALFLIILAPMSVVVVNQQSLLFIERFGKFNRIANPGLHIIIPFVEKISGRLNLRLSQLDVEVETKTLDNVFVKIMTSVQYKVLTEKAYNAFYTLDNAEAQIQAFVFDVVRAHVPNILLDDIFSKKDEIANLVKEELKEVMNEFGYDIIKALVTDINPDAKVKAAMNEINEAQRMRAAAKERGEAEKIIKVKQAEAEAESKVLHGQGIAGQRKAIIDGLKYSVSEFQKEIHDMTNQEVMNFVMLSQYFDTLKEMSMNGKSNTIMLPHSPSGMEDISSSIRNAIISANKVG